MKQEIGFLKTAVPPLLTWFRENKRDLPWRHERTPYTVLVSELMLQQTRVEAVKERYAEFLRRFPTAEALASASEDEVLKAWEGLGYYSRARNLHAAAKIIASEGFPRTWVGVKALPGVGDYTAGAICSVALGLPMPAVDGNVLRILSRLFADESNVDGAAVRKAYAEELAAVYPPEAGEFTEALMELGAIVCVPNGAPLCDKCQWRHLCRAHLAGREGDFPVRAEKKARKIEELNVFVLKCGNRYALQKRGKGLLAGLWEFPNAPAEAPADACCPPLGKVPLQGAKGVLAQKTAKHVFTHIEWHMTGYLAEVEDMDPQYVWATAEEIGKTYAVPSAFKAFLTWLK